MTSKDTDNYKPCFQEFMDMFGGEEAFNKRLEYELSGFGIPEPRHQAREISRRSADVLVAIAKRYR